ncbi:MAG: hypothetical protein K6E62_01390 [Lachnospiraceae bacterium]|nr:hypothetical protein [Lachnospiraceae bacterium]
MTAGLVTAGLVTAGEK